MEVGKMYTETQQIAGLISSWHHTKVKECSGLARKTPPGAGKPNFMHLT